MAYIGTMNNNNMTWHVLMCSVEQHNKLEKVFKCSGDSAALTRCSTPTLNCNTLKQQTDKEEKKLETKTKMQKIYISIFSNIVLIC